MYCIARRRAVERCAFERANLIIGAIDIAITAQRMFQTPYRATIPRWKGDEDAGLFSMREKCDGGSPESQVVWGRTRFWVSIVGYGTNFKRI